MLSSLRASCALAMLTHDLDDEEDEDEEDFFRGVEQVKKTKDKLSTDEICKLLSIVSSDCELALSLNPRYSKAYSSRAALRLYIGEHQERLRNQLKLSEVAPDFSPEGFNSPTKIVNSIESYQWIQQAVSDSLSGN